MNMATKIWPQRHESGVQEHNILIHTRNIYSYRYYSYVSVPGRPVVQQILIKTFIKSKKQQLRDREFHRNSYPGICKLWVILRSRTCIMIKTCRCPGRNAQRKTEINVERRNECASLLPMYQVCTTYLFYYAGTST